MKSLHAVRLAAAALRALFAAALFAGVCLPQMVLAQGYPQQRPILLIVPFAPGGGTDSIARELAKYLQGKLGQSVVVDNRGGAGGAIGAAFVAQAKPDGHTLLFVTSTFVTAAATERSLPYDVLKDFTPIAMIGRGPLLLVVNPGIGIASVKQLIDAAKARPDALNFVSAGPGSINHLSGELFMQRAGVRMTHIPYKGSGPATLDLISGQAQVFFATVPTILGQVRGERVRLLATTGKTRSRLFPDAPTVAESGVGQFAVDTWWGMVGPAGMQPTVVTLLNQAVGEATAGDALRKRFADEGAEPFRGGPAEFADVLRDELRNWRKVVQDAGIKLD
jgi:tripartite-type tricarboxylate transporter receptor subunit TctC